MSRLKKVQQYAIQWLDYHNHDSKHISKELNISENTVIKFLEKNRLINTKNNIKTSSSIVGRVKNKNLIITKSNETKRTENSSIKFQPIKNEKEI